jgi:hypothetical protein
MGIDNITVATSRPVQIVTEQTSGTINSAPTVTPNSTPVQSTPVATPIQEVKDAKLDIDAVEEDDDDQAFWKDMKKDA